MWIMTTKGFVSIVADYNNPGNLLVRGRKRAHVADFLDIDPGEVERTEGHDYLYRKSVVRAQVMYHVTRQLTHLDYTNFKGATALEDQDLAHEYGKVWEVMYRYQGKQERLHKYGYGKGPQEEVEDRG